MTEEQRRRVRYGRRCVVAAAVLWSLSGVIAKSLDLGPLTIAYYRSLFAGLALGPFVPAARRSFRPALLLLGLAFALMIGLYLGAVKTTTAANAIVLQCTASFWLIPASALMLRERPSGREVAAVGLALVGVAAIVSFGYVGKPNEGWGVALGLASGVGYAAVVLGLRILRSMDPIWLSATGNLGGALILGTWMVATDGSIPWPNPTELLVLIGFGVIQMAIPYALFARGLREVGATEAGLIGLLEPLLLPIWVWLGTGESPALATLIGGVLILGGLLCRYVPLPSFARIRPGTGV